MQIKAYLHRYSVSSSRFFIRPTQGIFVPSKIAVLKIAAFHCSFGVIHSTTTHYPQQRRYLPLSPRLNLLNSVLKLSLENL